MKRIALLLVSIWLWCAAGVAGQEAVVLPPESLVVDGVPKIRGTLAETAGRYGEYRSAIFSDWEPAKRSMLISTRFAATPQLHLVSQAGGERHQLTFFTDAVRRGRFHPNGGDYIVFPKDVGGRRGMVSTLPAGFSDREHRLNTFCDSRWRLRFVGASSGRGEREGCRRVRSRLPR